jgi:tetratricopeptide (TPR) repeat protein
MDEAKANAEIGLEKAAPSDSRATTSACEVLVKVALATSDYPGARRYAQLAEKADSSFPLPAYVEGLILHRQKRFEEALPLFLQAAQRLQGHGFAIPELYDHIGDTFGNLGQEQEAVAAFREEVRLFPAEIRARTHLAALLRAAGRNAAAAQVLNGLLPASPTPEGYRSAAEMWAIFGEKARAKTLRAEAERRFGRRAISSAGGPTRR